MAVFCHYLAMNGISQKLQNASQSVYQLFQMNKSLELKSVDEMNKSLAMN